jgi:pimeloyl-ACP methyl ester carboxylesterase
MNWLRFIPFLLLFGAFDQLAPSQTLIGSQGPYTWTDSAGGQIQITVSIYSNVPSFPGLYKWDYQVQNVSANSNNSDASFNGLGSFEIDFPQNVPDIANIYVPANWTSTTDSQTYVSVSSQLGPDNSTPPGPGSYAYYEPIYALPPGQTMHFGFTTLPRQVAALSSCTVVNDYLLNNSDCAFSLTAELARVPDAVPRRGTPTGDPARPAIRRAGPRPSYVNISGGGYFLTGQIAAPGLGSAPQAVDPIPDLVNDDGTILEDPESLATLGTPVVGITADGAARLLLRVPVANAGDSVQLTLFNDQEMQSVSTVADGTLASLDGTAVSPQIQVTAVSTDEGPMAFALYFPPTDFVRDNNTNDTTLNQRPVSIQVVDQSNGSPTDIPRRLDPLAHAQDPPPPPPGPAKLPVLLQRRLVYMVHGLWGSSDDFSLLGPILATASTNCATISMCVDYAYYSFPTTISSPNPSTVPLTVTGSSLGFGYNAPIVLQQLRTALSNFRGANGVTSAQADIVAHSMGGNITLTLLALPAYTQDKQAFKLGNIEKVITVATPYSGAPVAAQLLQSQNACPAAQLGKGGNWSISSAVVAGGATVNGAVFDLQTGASGGASPGIPTAAITSTVDMTTQTNLSSCIFCVAGYIRARCPSSSPLVQALSTLTGWQGIAGGPGDGIVPQTNQSSGSNITPLTGLLHSRGLRLLGFTGTAELDDPVNVPTAIINFFNTPAGVSTPALRMQR